MEPRNHGQIKYRDGRLQKIQKNRINVATQFPTNRPQKSYQSLCKFPRDPKSKSQNTINSGKDGDHEDQKGRLARRNRINKPARNQQTIRRITSEGKKPNRFSRELCAFASRGGFQGFRGSSAEANAIIPDLEVVIEKVVDIIEVSEKHRDRPDE